MRKQPTSNDVARRAGVSQTVVSFVMNNHPKVAPETRRRVQEAAVALGYRPNLAARSLVRGRSQTIGVLVVDLNNPFFAAATQHLEQAIRAAGYHFLLSTSTWDAWSEPGHLESAMDDLLLRGVDAIISWSLREPERPGAADPLNALKSRKSGGTTPLFVLGYDERAAGCAYLDHAAGGRLAGRHLAACGRRRLGAVVNFETSTRYEGFCQGAAEMGVTEKPRVWRDPTDLDTRGSTAMGYRAGTVIAGLPSAQRPDGLFCHHDRVAQGVIAALLDHGVRVPEDIAVVGFDALPDTEYLRPSLASVAYPVDELCQTIVAQAVRFLSGETEPCDTQIAQIAPLGLRHGQSAPLIHASSDKE
ncbi:MAG: LacI family DNA-binding transcriptional regulator [Armatimonadota bacterium]